MCKNNYVNVNMGKKHAQYSDICILFEEMKNTLIHNCIGSHMPILLSASLCLGAGDFPLGCG